MDRKYKVNDSAARHSSANGAQSKEVALEKLRKMEWKRNAQDHWHLARPNSRGSDVHERKKYNKEEDNYFEGTGVQKTKKMRRPRVVEGSPSAPPGFSVAQTSAAPQVNAWAQKKGSALFHKEDEIDEEDQVMKLVIEESLRSVEEDNKRRLERLRMTNLDLPAPPRTLCAEKDWEEDCERDDFHAEHSLDSFQEESTKAELHFVETDIKEEIPAVNQRHRSFPPRSRNISPREKSESPENKTNNPPKSVYKVSSTTVTKSARTIEPSSREVDNDDFFEPSRPQAKDKVNEASGSLSSYMPRSSSNMLPNTSVHHANYSDELADKLSSKLTFGDTRDLFEEVQEDGGFKMTGNSHNFKNETPAYPEVSDNYSEKKTSNHSEPSETDILLHSFIRHEPPSNMSSEPRSNVPDISTAKQAEADDLFTSSISPTYPLQNLSSTQPYLPHQMLSSEQHPIVNGLVGSALPVGIHVANGQDSSSSVSGSPLQNMTPIGSLEKETQSIIRTSMQVPSHIGSLPYQHAYSMENQESLTRHLQAMQLMNQNMPSTVNADFSPIQTPVRGMLPVNTPGGQAQYHPLVPNFMMSSYPGHISPLLMQQPHLQQAQMNQGTYLSQMLTLEAARLQQTQIPSGISESDEEGTKDEQVNQPQLLNTNLLAQNQAQMLSQTPQSQVLLQNPPGQVYSQTPQSQMLSHTSQNQILSQTPAQILAQSQVQAQYIAQAQAHMLSQSKAAQNQQQYLQTQQLMAMLKQPQSIPPEQSTPKQEELLQAGRAQPPGKTKEELQIEYQNVMQTLKRLQEEMQEVQMQPTIPPAQPQPWGVVPPSPSMPMAMSQFFQMGGVPQVHPHLIHQSQHTGLMSSINPLQNFAGSDVNLGSEVMAAPELPQPAVGRGRGRLH